MNQARASARIALLILACTSFDASPAPGQTAPPLPAACAILGPLAVGRGLGRPVTALSAALVGEKDAARAAHLANCVYSYERAPNTVALTVNLTPATRFDASMLFPGQRRVNGPWNFAMVQVDNRGGGILSVYDRRFDLTLWTPDFADRNLLAGLARSALGGPSPDAPKHAAPLPKRTTRDRYACEIFAPDDAARIVGEPLSASAPASDLCQYSATNAPYRVAATLALEPKPPGTAFDLKRIGDFQLNAGTVIQIVPALPYGHFVRPGRGPGATIFFDLGTLLVTVATPDQSDRGILERYASAVREALSGSRSSRSR